MMNAPLPGAPERRVALVTCAELPNGDADTHTLHAPLSALGVHAGFVAWDDPTADWASCDLAVVRSCWDYHLRRTEFLRWARRVPRLANPADVLAWNTDKQYLACLQAQGVDVVPTRWLRPGESWRLPAANDGVSRWVIKPAVSLAALDTGRYDMIDPAHRRLAEEHVQRLHDAGRTVMVQPYLSGIEVEGETSLVFIAGRFSHAMRKSAFLHGPDDRADRRFVPQGGLTLERREPSAAQLRLARRALSAVPGGARRLLYARIDLVPGPGGHPVVLELELTEPQLYLALVPEAATRLSDAIARRARSAARIDTAQGALP